MPRNMSFALTTEQTRAQTKTVTRRQGWKFVRVGDLLQPVEKSQGLKRGESVQKIGPLIRVISTRFEVLETITAADVAAEGFPEMSPAEFVAMYTAANKCQPGDLCNRIAFEYQQ